MRAVDVLSRRLQKGAAVFHQPADAVAVEIHTRGTSSIAHEEANRYREDAYAVREFPDRNECGAERGQASCSQPCSRANRTISMRLCSPSFCVALALWVSTVFTLSSSLAAISLLL